MVNTVSTGFQPTSSLDFGRQTEIGMERVSSGLKINSAKDDAAGLAISTRFTSRIDGLSGAIRNANDGISMAQTTEGGLANITENLQRIRELSVQSANGIYTDDDRQFIQKEVSSLQSEIGRIIESSTFNGQPLFNNAEKQSFQIGPDAGDMIESVTPNLSEKMAGVLELSLTDPGQSNSAIAVVDEALEQITISRTEQGAFQRQIESVVSQLSESRITASESRSRIQDADLAKELSEMTAADIRDQASIAVQAQANVNQGHVLALLNT